jgi:hypothetical protein
LGDGKELTTELGDGIELTTELGDVTELTTELGESRELAAVGGDSNWSSGEFVKSWGSMPLAIGLGANTGEVSEADVLS